MGKITYRPKKHSRNTDNTHLRSDDNRAAAPEESFTREEFIETPQALQHGEMENKSSKGRPGELGNVKPIGDLDCDYHIYLEDYVYTYLYQYALLDLSTESSAVFVGKYYPESKEVIVRGIIPIAMDHLSGDSEWIDEEVLLEAEQERIEYFKNEDIIGWMHMQPGYGTMLTMKELREHKKVFGDVNSIFMLVDAVNKIETLYVYEDEELKEQSGYYMYYERNEEMQRYMLDHPFVKKEVQAIEDTVVSQFREIGKLRKHQYMQRKNVNLTVVIASLILIGLTAAIVKMNDHKGIQSIAASKINTMENQMLPAQENIEEDDIKFIIQPSSEETKISLGNADLIGESIKTIAEEEIKEESKEEKLEAPAESVQQAEVKEIDEMSAIPEKQSGEKNSTNESERRYEEYIVKDGDTLANISYNRYGSASKSREIAQINGIGNTDYIRVGQTLKIPAE